MSKYRQSLQTIRELVLFALFGAMMFLTAQIDFIPNVHPLALFIAAFAAVYGGKGLIPVMIYVSLEGLYGAFNTWWIPYLYIWPFLWLLFFLIPRKQRLNEVVAGILITVVSGLHGIGFGLFYLPVDCYTMFKGNWEAAWLWYLKGIPFDVSHMVGNIAASLLAIPFIRLLCRLEGKPYPFRTCGAGKAADVS